MLAAHVFMGDTYYPESGLGDYKKSFYGEEAIEDAEDFADENFDTGRTYDWYVIIVDDGTGLWEHKRYYG